MVIKAETNQTIDGDDFIGEYGSKDVWKINRCISEYNAERITIKV